MNKQNIIQQLDTYKALNDEEAIYAQQLKQFLEIGGNQFDRSNLTAHVVADAWIVNPQRDKVLLIQHLLSQAYMAPGGHCDGSEDVFGSAIREAYEECGIESLKSLNDGLVFDINVGYVPTRQKTHGVEPRHLHFDVCFAFEYEENMPLKISEESTDLKWVALVDIPNLKGYWPDHLRRVEKTLKGWL